MSNTNRFISITSIAVLLVCGFACAQESSSKPAANNASANQNANQNANQQQQAPAEQNTQETVSTDNAASEGISQADILKVSEAFGHFIGRSIKAPGVNFDLDSIIKGMRDGYAGKPAPMSDKDYEQMMAKIQEQAYKKMSEENLKAANDFLEKNAKEPGVHEIEPGKLQYKILNEGNGAVVEEHFSPQIQYTGKFIDGSTFGSSSETGGPITIPLDQTIPGFSKGIVGMKEGEKRTLYVHPDLGYGTTGHLPPNSLLIFDVEVVKANAPQAESDSTIEDELSELSLSDEDGEIEFDDDDDDQDGHSDDKMEARKGKERHTRGSSSN